MSTVSTVKPSGRGFAALTRRVIQPSPSAGLRGAAAAVKPLMEPEEEAPPAPLPDILPETEPGNAAVAGNAAHGAGHGTGHAAEPDVTDEELGAMEELDEGLEDELPSCPSSLRTAPPQAPARVVKTKVFLGKIQLPFRLPADAGRRAEGH